MADLATPQREMTLREKIESVVTYHKPSEESVAKITRVREATANLLETIAKECPAGPDRSAAIRKAREAMMTANASIVVPGITL